MIELITSPEFYVPAIGLALIIAGYVAKKTENKIDDGIVESLKKMWTERGKK